MSNLEWGRAISQRLEELAGITDVPGQITRLYLSPAHGRAAELVASWMRDAGLAVEFTPLGDVVGRLQGAEPNAKRLLLASHIDSVRNAGKFDGTLGVIAAIELARRFHVEGKRLPFTLEVIAFGDEEGVRFPTSLSGSRAVAGKHNPDILNEKDQRGVTRRDALKTFGAPETPVERMRRNPGDTLGYVEVHIEQGPVLEARNLPLGVVTAINGCSRGSVVVKGWAGHAGTVPMALRKDALAAAAEMVLAVERIARADPDIVATVGQLGVPGGAINTVPGRVEFTLDIRSSEDSKRHKAVADIGAACLAIAEKRGVSAEVEMPYDVPAAICDAALSDALAQSIARCGFEPLRLASGAGHDAMSFRDALPFTMLFVRCKGGVSHNPAEYASIEDIDAAARTLADFVDHLVGR